MRQRIVLWIILAPLMLTVGSVLAQVFTSMVTVGVGSGPLIPGVAAQTSVNVPSLVQAVGNRSAPLTSQAYPINVTSGNVLIVLNGWESGTGAATISDTLSTSWTSAVSRVSQTENCNIYTGTAGSSGADTITVTLPSGAGFNGLFQTEWRNLTVTADGTNSGSTSGVLSLTTATAGDLVMTLIQGESSGGVTTPLIGWGYPSVSQGNGADSGGVQWYVQPAAGTINAGMLNTSSPVGMCAAAFKHS